MTSKTKSAISPALWNLRRRSHSRGASIVEAPSPEGSKTVGAKTIAEATLQIIDRVEESKQTLVSKAVWNNPITDKLEGNAVAISYRDSYDRVFVYRYELRDYGLWIFTDLTPVDRVLFEALGTAFAAQDTARNYEANESLSLTA